MSSDNYILVRRAGDRYAVTGESASAQSAVDDGYRVAALHHPTPIDSAQVTWFNDRESALNEAFSRYSEYGVYVETDDDASGDTFTARLATLAGSYEDSYCEHMRSNDHDAHTVTLEIGELTVTIAATNRSTPEVGCTPDAAVQRRWDQVNEYAQWISATTPEALRGLAAAPATEPAGT